MLKLDSHAEKPKSLGVSRAEIIDTGNVVVANGVRLKYQYGCGVWRVFNLSSLIPNARIH